MTVQLRHDLEQFGCSGEHASSLQFLFCSWDHRHHKQRYRHLFRVLTSDLTRKHFRCLWFKGVSFNGRLWVGGLCDRVTYADSHE